MMKPSVVVVGDMSQGSNSLSLAQGFETHVEKFAVVDTSSITSARIGSPAWAHNKFFSEGKSREIRKIEKAYTHALKTVRPDLVLCIKTISLDQSILLDAGPAVICHLSFDDVSNPDNTSISYLEMEKEWDIVFTTKAHNIEEMKIRGVKAPKFILGAFDPKIHFSKKDHSYRKFDVGFIGAARPDRIELPQRLANIFPNQAVVCGPRWKRRYPFGVNGLSLQNAKYGEKYNLLAGDIRAGLLLLNSANRDTHTNRTFEIPAAGQVIFGPATTEHLDLFENGKEGFFFKSFTTEDIPEMVQSIGDLKRLARIAKSGQERLLAGKHTYADRALEILGTAGLL
jgi:hypothetical protein